MVEAMLAAPIRTSVLCGGAVLATLLFGGNAVAETNTTASSDGEPPVSPHIVNGSDVLQCGWPTTVSTRGCTATLIHPKAIATAQHCGTPSRIYFGETDAGEQSVGVLGCVGQGSDDAMICELAEEVTQLPVTPVLFGCEVDMYMKVGQPVVMVGFGQTQFGVGGGTKLWANQTITAVEAGRTIIGSAGDGTSPCPGDSGGPVFVQVSDGSWRVFGTVLGGTTGTPCNSAADFQRIDRVVANFESQRGVDVTPCFDGQTGDWDPGPNCGQFYAGDHNGAGAWANWCPGTPASGVSTMCGPGYGNTGDADAGTSPGDADGGIAGGNDAGSGGMGDGDGEGGCGCGSGHSPGSSTVLALLVALAFARRRRSV